MSYKSKGQKGIFFSILAVLLMMACNTLTRVSPSTPVPASTKTVVVIINTATLSPAQFKPGDPTATPLGSDITDPNFIKGVEAFFDNDYEETITLMNAVIRATPDLAPPYRYRGGALALLGDCTAGLADAEKAISLAPDYAAAWAIRGLSYGCLGNEQQQLKDYEKALSIDPSLAFVHHNLGYYYFLQGDYEKSLEEYGLAVAIDPNRSFTWSNIAELRSRLGLYDECIMDATKALEVNMEEWVAYSVRGVCWQFLGDYQAAIQDYKIYLGHDPTDAPIWSNLGNAQREASLLEDAITSHNTALELDPSYYQANINRGLVYTKLGEYDKALDDFNHALEFGDIPAAYSGRGTVYYWMGRYEDAIIDLEISARAMPNSPHSFCMLALTYFEVGRYQDSLDAATRVNQISSGCGGQGLLETQARSYYELGDYEQAIFYMNQAMELQEYMMGYYYRGTMYQAAGKNEDAIKDFEIFLKLIPRQEDYQDEIADAETRLEQLKK